MQTVERWDVFEIRVSGPSTGNPFTEQHIEGVFQSKNETVKTDGFYDGDGEYVVRFMPSFEENYHYTLSASFPIEQAEGDFTVTAPGRDNHGPVRVANTFHFAYEDGTPYYSVGTTCYAWVHQKDAVIEKTLKELSKGYFN